VLRSANLAFVCEEQEAAQIMELLALVELAADTSAVFRAVQATHDMDRLDQAAVFLQGSHQRVLSAVALKFADEQRRGHPAHLDRPGYPEEIIPASQDEVLIQGAREQRLDVLVANGAIHSIQALIGHIPNARRELQTDQVEEAEN